MFGSPNHVDTFNHMSNGERCKSYDVMANTSSGGSRTVVVVVVVSSNNNTSSSRSSNIDSDDDDNGHTYHKVVRVDM